MSKKYSLYILYLISVLVIITDQAVKLLVVKYMVMGSSGEIQLFGDFFKLHYLLNPGMAFGIELPFDHSKIVLSIFRIFAVGIIGYYLYFLHSKNYNNGFLVCIALILGGAIGNSIDTVFYGIWLDNAPYDAPFNIFYGQVVDMFYINIWQGYLPEWLPIIGGSHMALWPIFNIADASIFVSICIILIFNKSFQWAESLESKNSEIVTTTND